MTIFGRTFVKTFKFHNLSQHMISTSPNNFFSQGPASRRPNPGFVPRPLKFAAAFHRSLAKI
jgi:hypothetical protein